LMMRLCGSFLARAAKREEKEEEEEEEWRTPRESASTVAEEKEKEEEEDPPSPEQSAASGSVEATDTPAVEHMLKGYKRFRDGDFGRLSDKFMAGP